MILEQLHHFGGLQAETILPPLTGPQWGYRNKARLGVKYVEKKGKVLDLRIVSVCRQSFDHFA